MKATGVWRSLSPGALAACDGDEFVRDRVFVQRGRPGDEAAAFRENHHGQFGRRNRTVRRWRLRPLRGSESRYRPLHPVSGAGSRTFRYHREMHSPRVIATGRIMATVIPGSIQSNRDRAELIALRRLGTVEDCAKVVEFLATDLSDYVTGAVIPIDGGLVRG
jgi:hypothetical protein